MLAGWRSVRSTNATIGQRRPMGAAPLDLYDYAEVGGSLAKRKRRRRTQRLRVTDNWPEVMPVTEAEVRVIEAYFTDILDELFGPLP